MRIGSFNLASTSAISCTEPLSSDKPLVALKKKQKKNRKISQEI
jgi:hypothetical protein